MRKKKETIIVGAGISGLSLAWYLRKNGYQEEMTIIEKEDVAGGYMQSQEVDGFFFEKGPRTFRVSKNHALLSLLQELDVEHELIFASSINSSKYLWWENKLQKVPDNLWQFCISPLTRPFLPSLLREWKISKTLSDDESIHSFFSRRFSPQMADIFFDALTIGIYAASSKQLSIRSCFPTLKKWEEEYGSVTKGLFFHPKEKKKFPFSSSLLFTLRSGMGLLIQKLLQKLDVNIHFQEEVKNLVPFEGKYVLETGKNTYEADTVFFTAPSYSLSKILPSQNPLVPLLECLSYTDITCAQVAYKEPVLPVKGFGYLIPSNKLEKVLGVVFDSDVFPQQNKSSSETRLTVMASGDEEAEKKVREICVQALEKHLGISKTPSAFSYTVLKQAIPKYEVGHEKKIVSIKSILENALPNLYILGTYLGGVSVNDCIAQSQKIANVLKK